MAFQIYWQVSPDLFKQNLSKKVLQDRVPKKDIYIFLGYLGKL